MLSEFPNFRHLRLGDRAALVALTKRYPPFSDFNFTSLYSWDTNETVQVAVLNGNLAVRFVDYTTQEPFYSFLGDNYVDDTANKLSDHARACGITPELRLVPEVSAWRLTPGNFDIREDEDNCDYILGIERLKTYQGNKLGPKRNFVNRFNKSYEAATVRVDLGDVAIQTRFLDLYHRWLIQKGSAAENPENELLALHRVMFAARQLPDLYVVGTFIGDDLAGFSINDLVGNGYAMIHFEKADAGYTGIYAQLMQQMSRLMEQKGCRYINYEQDLGIPGLRKGKSSYIPSHYLRKYVLCPRSASTRPAPETESISTYMLVSQAGSLRGEAWQAPPLASTELAEDHSQERQSSAPPSEPSSEEPSSALRYSIPPSESSIGVNLPPLYAAWTDLYDLAIAARAGDSIPPPPPSASRSPVRERPLGGALDVAPDAEPTSFRTSMLPPRPEGDRDSVLPPPMAASSGGSISLRPPPMPRISVIPEAPTGRISTGMLPPSPAATVAQARPAGQSNMLPPPPPSSPPEANDEAAPSRARTPPPPIPREEPPDTPASPGNEAWRAPPPPVFERPRMRLGVPDTPRSAVPPSARPMDTGDSQRPSAPSGVVGLRLPSLNLERWLDEPSPQRQSNRPHANRPVSFSRSSLPPPLPPPPADEEPIPDTRPSNPSVEDEGDRKAFIGDE